jgi:hypothetical protein
MLKEKYDGLERKVSSRPDGLFAKINGYRILATATEALKENEEKNVADALSALDEAVKIVNDFMNKEWPAYQKNMAEKTVSVEAVIK